MSVYLGLDWSQSKHDVCFLNEAGSMLTQVTIPHSVVGFAKLEHTRQQLGVTPHECVVGLETAHHLVLDVLWNQGYQQVYVIAPSVVSASRSRYRQSGARSDKSDAFLLADLVRSDRKRWSLWQPDGLLVRQMKSQIGLIGDLTQQIVQMGNRLHAVLLRYYPAALTVFSDLLKPISLHFVRTYPTPQHAAELTLEAFTQFAKQHRYPYPKKLTRCFERLQQPHPAADAATVVAYQGQAVRLANILLMLVQAKRASVQEMQTLFQSHPDKDIFASLPGAGDYLAPALLVHFGDHRTRFPTAQSVQAVAGTCPVTHQSGKQRQVRFRKACDRPFRTICQQFAQVSLRQCGWAQSYWEQVRAHVASDAHATRCLANRWLAIIWKLWQSHQAYDEAYHLQQRLARSKPRA